VQQRALIRCLPSIQKSSEVLQIGKGHIPELPMNAKTPSSKGLNVGSNLYDPTNSLFHEIKLRKQNICQNRAGKGNKHNVLGFVR